MPTYDIQNKKTGEVKEIFCSYKDKEKTLKKEGPNWEYLMSTPSITTDGSMDVMKRANNYGPWSDVMSQMKRQSGKDNTLNT